MLLQQSPFRGEDEDEIYDAILADEPLYPIHMPRDSVSILQKLLTREPELRLGSGPTDAQEIMSHAFFRNINWDDIYNKRVPAPFIPTISSPTDTSNFDSEFTSVTPVLTPVQSGTFRVYYATFKGQQQLTLSQSLRSRCRKSSAASPTRPTSPERHRSCQTRDGREAEREMAERQTAEKQRDLAETLRTGDRDRNRRCVPASRLFFFFLSLSLFTTGSPQRRGRAADTLFHGNKIRGERKLYFFSPPTTDHCGRFATTRGNRLVWFCSHT